VSCICPVMFYSFLQLNSSRRKTRNNSHFTEEDSIPSTTYFISMYADINKLPFETAEHIYSLFLLNLFFIIIHIIEAQLAEILLIHV